MNPRHDSVWWRILRDPIVLLVAGIVLAYVLTNGVMLWVSLRGPSELVSSDYYAQSKRVNERQAAERESAQSGWRIAVNTAVSDKASLVFQVSDAAGKPLNDLAGAAQAYRPSDSDLDQQLLLEPLEGSPGVYRARFTDPRPGLWEISLALTGATGSVRERIRYVAP